MYETRVLETALQFVKGAAGLSGGSGGGAHGGRVWLGESEHEKVGMLTLSNPGSANAVTPAMMVDLVDAVSELYATPSIEGVVIRGDPEGRAFCAGADLSEAKELLTTREGRRAMSVVMQETLTALRAAPVVSAAAVGGSGAYGGGAEFITAADGRVVGSQAKIVFVHARRGMSPGWGGGTRLRSLLPQGAAGSVFVSASPVTGVVRELLVDVEVEGGDERVVQAAVEWVGERLHGRSQVARVKSVGYRLRGDEEVVRSLREEGDVFVDWDGDEYVV